MGRGCSLCRFQLVCGKVALTSSLFARSFLLPFLPLIVNGVHTLVTSAENSRPSPVALERATDGAKVGERAATFRTPLKAEGECTSRIGRLQSDDQDDYRVRFQISLCDVAEDRETDAMIRRRKRGS